MPDVTRIVSAPREVAAPAAEIFELIVTHTHDWTDVHHEARLERARSTTTDRLLASIDRLATLAVA